MKTPLLLILSLALGAFAAPALTQTSMPARRTVHRDGDWYVVRSVQRGTGQAICTGFHMGHAGLQLSKDSLIIRTPGDLQSIGLRYGDEPAPAARPPSAAEKQIGAVMIAGPEFEKLRRSQTLGLDIQTSQEHAKHMLKLNGIEGVLKNIEAGCPTPKAVERADRRAQQVRERVQRERCEPANVRKMRERGVPELRIRAMCPNAPPPPEPPASAPAASAPSASAPTRPASARK